MSTKLENFVKGNRKEFDEAEPPAGLWDRIEQELDDAKIGVKQERVVKLSFLLKIAATVLIVLTAGLFAWNYQKQAATDIGNINPELENQQVQYASLIETKRNELRRIEKEDPQLYNEFSLEIKKMDVSYQRLKNDLPTSPNQEETVKAMIRNLQTQIEVLNQQLTIIQQIRQIKKQQNEKQTI